MKAVFAFDSFKGSASSAALADAASRAFLEILPDAETKCFPVADGGEGCIESLLASHSGATMKTSENDFIRHRRANRGRHQSWLQAHIADARRDCDQ